MTDSSRAWEVLYSLDHVNQLLIFLALE